MNLRTLWNRITGRHSEQWDAARFRAMAEQAETERMELRAKCLTNATDEGGGEMRNELTIGRYTVGRCIQDHAETNEGRTMRMKQFTYTATLRTKDVSLSRLEEDLEEDDVFSFHLPSWAQDALGDGWIFLGHFTSNDDNITPALEGLLIVQNAYDNLYLYAASNLYEAIQNIVLYDENRIAEAHLTTDQAHSEDELAYFVQRDYFSDAIKQVAEYIVQEP